MAYKVLYRKYRPDTFDNVYGQDNIKRILIESIKSNKISHAYLFHGPRGTGKTSTAKLFAKLINCQNNTNGEICGSCTSCLSFNDSSDIIEIDAASNNGVDEIRNLRDSTKILPTFSKYKVYIIDEVHMLSQSAWNAFLKTLEEPPAHVIFILATTELQKIPLTILSRCQRFSFKKLTIDIIKSNLSRICKLENISITDDALYSISELADGAMRDGLSILDQLSKENAGISADLVFDTFGIVGNESIKKLFDYYEKKDINSINIIFNDYIEKGLNVNLFISKILNYLLQLEIDIINGKNYFLSLNDLKKISQDISNVFGKNDALLLIKIILFSYYKINSETYSLSTGNVVENIVNDNKEIKNETIEEKPIIIKEENKIDNKIGLDNQELDRIKNIRINNSYVNASKDLKNNFIKNWKLFLENLNINGVNGLLNFASGITPEVVSSTNVLFSAVNKSTAVLFNNNLVEVENSFFDFSKQKLSFICLSYEEWTIEKEKYVKLLKNKKNNFVYIDERDNIVSSKSLDSASDIFGDNLLEVK